MAIYGDERQVDHHTITYTYRETLEICLMLAEEFAATEQPVNDTMAPWMRIAVDEIRSGGTVTPTDIAKYQAMGTS